MRKVAREIVVAILTGTTKKVSNTTFDAKTGEVFLHGNRILTFLGGQALIDSTTVERWDTVTTRSRVNEILGGLGILGGLSRKAGKTTITQPV